MFPGINLLYCCVLIHRTGLSRKLVKIGGSSEPLEPPWLRACKAILVSLLFVVLLSSLLFIVIPNSFLNF